MKKNSKLLFLGTGSSSGVPMIACDCIVCSSTNEKNKRLRPSCLLQIDDKNLLLDVSPDFREQALKYKIKKIDGLILTHSHYDHLGGLDDLRVFYLINRRPIKTLLSHATYEEIKKSFHYLFKPIDEFSSLSTQLIFDVLEKDKSITTFLEEKVEYFEYFQKNTAVTGYRFGSLAYVTDIKKFSKDILSHLEGLDILILSALREEKSPVHFNLEEAIDFAQKVGAKKTYFTHIAHEVEHENIEKKLPPNIHLAYDGLKLEFDND